MPPDSHAELAAAAMPLQDVIQVEGGKHTGRDRTEREGLFCDNLHVRYTSVKPNRENFDSYKQILP